MTKILNLTLKVKAGGREGGTCEVLRPCHPPKKKFGTCTSIKYIYFWFHRMSGVTIATSSLKST